MEDQQSFIPPGPPASPPPQGNSGAGKPVIRSRGQMPAPDIYGRLELRAPIALANGTQSSEVVVYRPSAKVMTEVLDTIKQTTQIDRFVSGCCRAVNGGTEPVPFRSSELLVMDSYELGAVIAAMSEDADGVIVEENGDGVTSPLIYTLQKPIRMTPAEDSEVVEQFAFEARKVGDISEFLDAMGETKQFYTFMRTFGKPLGLRIPIMTDVLIGAIDFLDYLVIRRQIMGKFVSSQKRWKKESLAVH